MGVALEQVLMLTLENPPPTLETCGEISGEDYRKNYSKHFQKMVEKCLQKNPEHRLLTAIVMLQGRPCNYLFSL